MKYVVILEVDESELDGAEDIEHACSIVNDRAGSSAFAVRPLSEEIAC